MKKVFFICICFLSISGILFSDTLQDRIISKARTLIGTPYRSGGVSPSGFDCSGFITYLYKAHVPELPRVSRDMARTGNPVDRSSLVPGDLVFFATGSSAGRVTHVALYIGQNSIIHSISNGPETGVTISSLNSGYWKNRYHNSTRIVKVKSADNISRAENFIFAKGIYNGSLKNGEPSGNGILLMKNGDRYKGDFEKGLFHGKGTYIWADGRSFNGNFIQGEFSGKGIMLMSDGEEIAGSWRSGIFTPDRPAETADASADTGEKPAASFPDLSSSVSQEPGSGEKAAAFKEENYFQKDDSPWSTYEGIVEGDFSLWFKKDMEKFEEWKKTH